MKTAWMSLLALGITGNALAQNTPVGLWRNVDDKTGEVKAEIRITEAAGALSGNIEKLLRKDAKPDERCDKCSDDRKDKPVLGLQIIRGGKKTDGHDLWEGGKILDPENGREYTLRLKLEEAGKLLEVRGYLGPFWRTQHWHRVP